MIKRGKVLTDIIGVLSLLSVVYLWKYNTFLTTILMLLSTLMLLIKKSKKEVKIFLFGAFFGSIAEAIAVSSGAWYYKNPSFIGIPIWLILLWGIASVYIVRIYQYFSD